MAGCLLGAAIAIYLIAAGEPWLAAAAATAWLVGLADDIGKDRDREVGWRGKAVGLLIAGAFASVHLDAQLDLSAWQLALLFVFLFATTNAFNFLDNTDGVAASLGVLALLLTTAGQGVLAPIAFLYLGFLPLNWPRPLFFLGDAGALPLGLCAGTGAASALPHWAETVAPVAIPLLDFTQVLAARLGLGIPPWVGDRRHLTHIAMNLSLPRILVAPLFAGLGWLAWWAINRA
jgi:UDP-GlcNAc:undecaprenyl-phosphate GlcNAc-1-phosphate transferase